MKKFKEILLAVLGMAIIYGAIVYSGCKNETVTPHQSVVDSFESAFDTLCTLPTDGMKDEPGLRTASNYVGVSDTGIIYGQGNGLHGLEQLKMNVTYPQQSVTLHRLQIDVHGGGGKIGSRKATGTVPIYKGNTAQYGDVYAYIDYPLGIPSSKDSATISRNTGEEMYRTLQSIYACCRYFANPVNSAKYHVDPKNIWISGVSWGAGAAYLSIHWNPDEYYPAYVRDTAKWFNNSNPGFPFHIAGVIGISGFVFNKSEIDATNVPMIILHGGADNLIHCDGGAVQKVQYIGGCEVNELSTSLSNPTKFLLEPNGGHGLKVPNDPLATLQNLMQARSFINQSIQGFH